MNFLAQLLQGIAFVPAVVHGIEGLFGGRPGTDKKQRVPERFYLGENWPALDFAEIGPMSVL